MTNKILRFAYSQNKAKDNLLTIDDYRDYNQDGQSRQYGNTTGVADNALNNTALAQASAIMAGVAEYIAQDGKDIDDSITADVFGTRIRNRLCGKPVGKVIDKDYTITDIELQYTANLHDTHNPYTITLPKIADVPVNGIIRIKTEVTNAGSSIKIASADGDGIFTPATGLVTNITINSTTCVEMLRPGGNDPKWQVRGDAGIIFSRVFTPTRPYPPDLFYVHGHGLIENHFQQVFNGAGTLVVALKKPSTIQTLTVITTINSSSSDVGYHCSGCPDPTNQLGAVRITANSISGRWEPPVYVGVSTYGF